MIKKRALVVAQRRADNTGLSYAAVPITPTHWTAEPSAYVLSVAGRRAYPLHAQAEHVKPALKGYVEGA